MRVARCLSFATAILFFGLHSLAGAQDNYPSKPIKFVVPFAPGGGTDIVGRIIATRLQQAFQAAVASEYANLRKIADRIGISPE